MRNRPERDEGYVEDAIELCDRVAAYMLEAPTFEAFKQDPKLEDAVMLQLIYIGEACSRITEERQELNPTIEWHSIKGMRNRLAHDYWREDPERVYETAVSAVPKLKALLQAFRYQ